MWNTFMGKIGVIVNGRERNCLIMSIKKRSYLLLCDPAGTRTQGPYIKSVLLYQLSYEINLFLPPFGFGSAKIQSHCFQSKNISACFQHYFN